MSEVHLVNISNKGGAAAELDIIFVHGLHGDSRRTWHPESQPDIFWPEWLAEEIPRAQVHCLGYPAAWSDWFDSSSNLGILERANNILQYLAAAGIGDRPIVFIAHSLGGLMVKQLLRTATSMQNKAWLNLQDMVRGVIFVATPHTGSSLANVISLASIARRSQLTKELETGSSYLRDLGVWFQQNAGMLKIQVQAYYESRPTKGVAIVVDPNSANPGTVGCVPVGLDGDHFSVCKPQNRQSLLYLSAKSFVNELLSTRPWKLYLIPGYSAREKIVQDVLLERSLWPVSKVVEEDSHRLCATMHRAALKDNSSHIFIINLAGILKRGKSEIEAMMELIQVCRTQGRVLADKPVFILLGTEDERASIFSALRTSEQSSLSLYFRLDPSEDQAVIAEQLSILRRRIQTEWLVRPLSSSSPV